MRCCNIINSLITGFPPDPVPDPDQSGFLWYAELTGIVWSSNNAVTVDGDYADVVYDNPALAVVIQNIFGSNTSGVWMIPSGQKVFIWAYQTDQPTPVVVNFDTGVPIDLVWQQGAQDLVETCWEATLNVSDPPNTNTDDIVTDEGFDPTFNVSGASFDNPAIATVLDTIFHQTFGASASLYIVDQGGGNYLITISDTLIIPTSIDTTAAETANFSEIPCP